MNIMHFRSLDQSSSSAELERANLPVADISPTGLPAPWTADYLWLSVIREVDGFLRRRQHIIEFCHDPRCLLRIALHSVEPGDPVNGSWRLQPGERVGELHFWNEHIPPVPAGGPNLAWAKLIRQRMFGSFALLAESVRTDASFKNVQVFFAKTRLGADKPRAHFERLTKPFGFERIEELACRGWQQKLVGLGECVHFWALLRAFNPETLTHRRFFQLPARQLWISRKTLLEKYPPAGYSLAR